MESKKNELVLSDLVMVNVEVINTIVAFKVRQQIMEQENYGVEHARFQISTKADLKVDVETIKKIL